MRLQHDSSLLCKDSGLRAGLFVLIIYSTAIRSIEFSGELSRMDWIKQMEFRP